ncbi:hypothetical protein E3N88_00577 [Mikania micrantha]|uniref:F-box domain-containing protein n=1 Tax=Mikania micrantha TaxID=192012 RepID=A0A5N6Q0E4_9ASTR|nr:hypothetical protein E3N88_00577 [Mikania micrantha]
MRYLVLVYGNSLTKMLGHRLGSILLHKLSGKKCYMLAARDLSIPESRFEYQPAEVSVGLCGVDNQTDGKIKPVFLDPGACGRQRYENDRFSTITPQDGPKLRRDGWLEIELGEFYNEKGQEGKLDMSMMEVKGGNWKAGLIIQGIEIRPKAS